MYLAARVFCGPQCCPVGLHNSPCFQRHRERVDKYEYGKKPAGEEMRILKIQYTNKEMEKKKKNAATGIIRKQQQLENTVDVELGFY